MNVTRRRHERGMTLIEVLVALLIFSFGLLGLVGLQGRAHTFALSAEDSNRAALLANEIVASIVLAAGSAGTIVAPDPVYWTGRASATPGGLPNGAVAFGAVDITGKQMAITITWKSPTAPATAASNSYKTMAVLP